MTGETQKTACCRADKKAPQDAVAAKKEKERDVLILEAYEMADEEEQGGCCGGSCGCGG